MTTEKLNNQWLFQNNITVQRIKRQLVEYGYRGGEELPSRTIQGILESAIIEIARLQRELDRLEGENKKLITQAEIPTQPDENPKK